jgi:3-oxoacyl-[acyl-carrier protein] reductase
MIVGHGGAAFTVGADFSRSGGVDELFAALDRELASRTASREFDILVNNAAVASRAVIEDVTEADFDRMIQVNLKAPFLIIRAASNRLREGARIINVSSIATRRAYPELAAYATSKAGLEVLTVLLAEHFGPRGIYVNAVLAGATATAMNPRASNPELADALIRTIALRRVGQAHDIASVIAFLASDDAGWITGECIFVSGGQRL